MSSSDAAPTTVSVRVEADPDTEVFVIDHAFNLRARGVGGASADLEPGLYKLKFKAGSLIREVHEIVEPGPGPVVFTSPELRFASPAPLAETDTSHEYQEEAASTLSHQVHERIGSGSQIFVFARLWTGHDPDPAVPLPNPAKGLTLHDAAGTLLVDFERQARAGDGTDPSAGCTAELAPGVYRLRVRTQRWGALEQTLVASPGWQTQVFLWHTGDDGGTVPDLSSASILMAPAGDGFSSASAALRSTELARVALASRRAFMPRHQLQEMLDEGEANPMVGIYAAHALVAAGEDDHDLLTQVITRLTELVGGHPDVEALKLFVEGETADHRYETPPMLATSWTLIVEASARRPELVPAGSLAARVSSRLWGDSPWLIWLADDLDERASAPDVPLGQAVSRLAGLTAETSFSAGEAAIAGTGVELNDLEDALLASVTRRSARTGAAGTAATDEATLATSLGVPPAALGEVASTLLAKLEAAPDDPAV